MAAYKRILQALQTNRNLSPDISKQLKKPQAAVPFSGCSNAFICTLGHMRSPLCGQGLWYQDLCKLKDDIEVSGILNSFNGQVLTEEDTTLLELYSNQLLQYTECGGDRTWYK